LAADLVVELAMATKFAIEPASRGSAGEREWARSRFERGERESDEDITPMDTHNTLQVASQVLYFMIMWIDMILLLLENI
jgi:hypothetical protein